MKRRRARASASQKSAESPRPANATARYDVGRIHPSACARWSFPAASDIAEPYLDAYVNVQNQKLGNVPAWSMSRHTAANGASAPATSAALAANRRRASRRASSRTYRTAKSTKAPPLCLTTKAVPRSAPLTRNRATPR